MRKLWLSRWGSRKDVHVLPVRDIREHLEHRQCWCVPAILREGEGIIVVHAAADGRDLVEAHGVN